MQALKREFKTLTVKNNEKVDAYSTLFVHVIPSLRNLEENFDDSDVVSRLLRSILEDYDRLILPLEQFGDLKTMRQEEAIGDLKALDLRL